MLRKAILLFLFIFCQPVLASETDLAFSEIMYNLDGADSGHEWMEIYNSGTDDVIASSTWRFFDSSNHKIKLYQGTSTIATNDFFILADDAEQFILDYPDFSGNIYDTVMSLSNSSSSIALSFDGGFSYELEEYYDPLWGANGNGYSLEKIDLLASSTDNWQESSILGGTPGIINSQIEEVIEEKEQTWLGLVINELLPNPEGSDDKEWIELYNNGLEILNLEGLKIKDNSSRVFTLDSDSELDLRLTSHSYLLIPKSVSGISLNNSNGDSITIMDPIENIIDSVSYSGTASESRSYARSDNGFVWTKTPTPGEFNQILFNQPPIAQIAIEGDDFLAGTKLNFTASNSYDSDGEDLDYLWEFGDGKISSRESIKHSFDNIGSYTVRLTVIDSEGAFDTVEFSLYIYQTEEEIIDEVRTPLEEVVAINLAEDDLIISEFIPNPEGSDDKEWIELYNASDKDIDLQAWYLDDMEGGSKPWRFSTGTILSKGYLVLTREETKITLNNSGDSVRLLTPLGDLWQEVSYEKIPEGKAYAWDHINSEWAVNNPSPGLENTFIDAKEEVVIYGVAEVNDLEKNQEIIVQGIAINNIDDDSRSLYLVDYNFSEVNYEELIEIYSYYKNFIDIKIGDLVTVQGKISRLDDLPRVKIKEDYDLWKNNLSIDLSEPEIIDVEDIDEDLLGSYINIKGIVVKKSGKNIYLASDIEGDYLVRVYSKFFTKELAIKKGNELMVAGILTETDNGFKLVPFEIGDIAVSKQVLGEKIIAEELKAEELSASTSKVIIEDNKKSIKDILIFILVGLVLMSIVYFIKDKKREI